MSDRWRSLVERVLPWYNPTVERIRDKRTEAIARRSTATRARAKRVIADYRAAAKEHGAASDAYDKAGDRLVDEIRDQ